MYFANLYKHFYSLMTTPCKVYSREKTVNALGLPEYTKTQIYEGVCNFHSLNIKDSVFADRIGSKSAFLICLPIECNVSEDDMAEIDGKEYKIEGVRKASRQFEKICEATLNE